MSSPQQIVNEPVAEIKPLLPTAGTVNHAEDPPSTEITCAHRGPFCSIAHQGSESQFGQRLKSLFPLAFNKLSSMHGVLATADKGICITRELMASNEGRRLSAAWTEFVMSLFVFASMIFAMIFTEIENYLDVPIEESPKTLSDRFCTIVSTVSKSKDTKITAHNDEVPGRSEGHMYAYAKLVATLMFHAVMCMASGLLRFDGPGREYVVPIVEKVVGLMPSSLKASVKETDGPMTLLKKYMGGGDDSAAEGDKTD